MGHTISRRKEIGAALALSLGHFRNQASVLAITCRPCEGTRELSLSALGERYGCDLLLGTIILRLRRRRCRRTLSAIRLAKRPGTAGLILRGPVGL